MAAPEVMTLRASTSLLVIQIDQKRVIPLGFGRSVVIEWGFLEVR